MIYDILSLSVKKLTSQDNLVVGWKQITLNFNTPNFIVTSRTANSVDYRGS